MSRSHFDIMSMKTSAATLLMSLLASRAAAINITPTDSADQLSVALFKNPDFIPSDQLLSPGQLSAGTFTDGPLGLNTGAILTTGLAAGAAPGSTERRLNPSNFGICSNDNLEETSFSVSFSDVSTRYSSKVKINYIFASDAEQGIPFSRAVILFNPTFTGESPLTENIAKDRDGNDLTSVSPEFLDANAIKPPQSGTSYRASTNLQSIVVRTDRSYDSAFEGQPNQQMLFFVVCSSADATKDAALLFNIEGCESCNLGVQPQAQLQAPSSTSSPARTPTTTPARGATTTPVGVVSSVVPPILPTPSRAAVAPSNQPIIGRYESAGCLGSAAGFPSFTEIGQDAQMTPNRCIDMANGRNFIGVFNTGCYAADNVDDTLPAEPGVCNIPCPGNPSVFCGGRRATQKRAAPADAFLTLYRLNFPRGPGGVTYWPQPNEGDKEQGRPPKGGKEGGKEGGKGHDDKEHGHDDKEHGHDDEKHSPGSKEQHVEDGKHDPEDKEHGHHHKGDKEHGHHHKGDKEHGHDEEVKEHTHHEGGKHHDHPKVTTAVKPTSVTQVASHVTTIEYLVVDPVHKHALVPTQYCTTITYNKCQACKEQHIPEVPMTTAKVECHRCGKHGEDYAVITAPVAALETALPGKHQKGAEHAGKEHDAEELDQEKADHGHPGKVAGGQASSEGVPPPKGHDDEAASPKGHKEAGSSAGNAHGATDGKASPNANDAYSKQAGSAVEGPSGKQGNAQPSHDQAGSSSAAQQGQQAGANKAEGGSAGQNGPAGAPSHALYAPGAQVSGHAIVSGGHGVMDTLCVGFMLAMGAMAVFW
ncbi:hypothetical protein HJFPF1_09248 [Paramyrothecium foliicola]|nr:hypothetical protein HJFPF1_09248 [Paramyrothecium foliicola]